MRRLCLVALTLVTAALPASVARADPAASFRLGISDARIGLDRDPLVRAASRDVARSAGGSVVRIPVSWRDVVSFRRPSGDLGDPANSGYNFISIDRAVRELAQDDFEPLLYVLRAPPWAEAPDRWRFAAAGSWAPDPAQLGLFAQALARRYDGAYPDPLTPGAALPRVGRFQSWNEPNLPNYIQPQWVVRGGQWAPFAPHWYRKMHNAFSEGVQRVSPTAMVGTAGTAPVGEAQDGAGRMAPLRFLHAFACLQPPPSLEGFGCANPARVDALALHPLSVGDPDRRADQRLDFAVADVTKATGVIDAARRLGLVVSAEAPRLWITELNWESGPPPQVPNRLQAGYVSRGLRRLWQAGAEIVLWHFVADPPRPLDGRQRPAGLTRLGRDGLPGSPKPFLRAFALPLTVSRIAPGDVRLWTIVPRGAVSATVEQRTPTGWKQVRDLRGARGPLERTIALTGSGALRVTAGARTSQSVTVSGG